MVKEELARALQRELGEPSFEESRELVEDVFEAIAEGLLRDGKVVVLGFGTFHTRPEKAREVTAPDPQTKRLGPGFVRTLTLPPRLRVLFRSSEVLVRKINPGWVKLPPPGSY